MVRLLLALTLAFALLLAFLPRAGAQDAASERPILLLRMETGLGYSFADRRVGLTGAVYSLVGSDTGAGADARVESVQIAYNAENRAVLARFVQRMESTEDGAQLARAAQAVFSYLLPNAAIENETFAQQVAEAAQAFLDTNTPSESQIEVAAGAAARLSFLQDGGLGVLDLPVQTPAEQRLSADELGQAISDATVTYPDQGLGALHRYHAPNGGYAETSGSGTWEIRADGQYCIEQAPAGTVRCAAVYRIGDAGYVEVEAMDTGAPQIRDVQITYGNPSALSVPRHSDAIAAAVAKMILPGRTEHRRNPDGSIDRLYLDSNGTVRGEWGDELAAGQWTVLGDGRRCLTLRSGQSGWLEAECAFLSETDGGTYRLYDGMGDLLGEALYTDGNPNDF